MVITNDQELKAIKKRISQLTNALNMFDYADFPSDIIAEGKKVAWEKELEKLEKQVEEYKHPQ